MSVNNCCEMDYDQAVNLPANDHAKMGDATPLQYARIIKGLTDATPKQVEAAKIIVMHDFATGSLEEWLAVPR